MFKLFYFSAIHITMNSSIWMFAYTQHLKNKQLKNKQLKIKEELFFKKYQHVVGLLSKLIYTKKVTDYDIKYFEQIFNE